MTRAELIEYCLTYPDAYEDYPFEDPNWTCMRRRSNRRIFAFVFEREGELCANLKCEPMTGDFLRQAANAYVRPAYHMNKQHWITVIAGACPQEELRSLIGASYVLTQPKSAGLRCEKIDKTRGGRVADLEK